MTTQPHEIGDKVGENTYCRTAFPENVAGSAANHVHVGNAAEKPVLPAPPRFGQSGHDSFPSGSVVFQLPCILFEDVRSPREVAVDGCQILFCVVGTQQRPVIA